jgi:curved DNA-binding protein CbpA
VDPHDVLGVAPGASEEQIARAYRELAKRFHPDRADALGMAGGAGGELMRQINQAYAALREERRTGAPPRPARPRARSRRSPGHWLAPDVCRVLGAELLGAFEPGEPVLVVTTTTTWDSHDVRLVVTDRRLLWLRDDAIVHRVRWLRYPQVEQFETRLRRPRRRVGELRVRDADGRRVSFGELRPDVLAAIVRAVLPRLPAERATG